MKDLTPSSLVNGSIKLFSLPDIFIQITQLVNDPHSSSGDIGEVLSKDPALSARLLKIVNSSFYNFHARVDTITRAITIVGVEDLQNLILATSVIDKFKNIPSELVDISHFWIRSINCGIFSKLIAHKNSVLHAERLFLAGLLHDIGSLVLYTALPEVMMEVLLAANKDSRLVPQMEKEIIGFDHAEVGGELIKAWKLPDSLYEAVRYHLTPELSCGHQLDTHIVNMAYHLCIANTQGVSLQEIIDEIPEETFRFLGMDESTIIKIMEMATDDFAKVFEVIGYGRRFY
ncbi:MAG: HDOD domain-containing protein [Gammaproteobacteria bacterium]